HRQRREHVVHDLGAARTEALADERVQLLLDGVVVEVRIRHAGMFASRMPTRLADETSPYLQQHKDNPVDWYPWSQEAFERARAEDKPGLLHVGYARCH